MKQNFSALLLAGLLSAFLTACGGGGSGAPESAATAAAAGEQKQETLAFIQAAASCTAWVEGGTYAAGQVVTFNGATYTALVNQTDFVGTGWNPTVRSLFSPGGNCGDQPPPPQPPPTNPKPATGIVSGATYKLINPGSGLALDVAGCGNANGTPVQLWANGVGVCNNGKGQQWSPRLNADNTYTMINPATGLALDVAGCSTANGSRVQMWADGVGVCNGGAGQKWAISDNGDGSYSLVHPQSGNALDVAGCGNANGTPIQTWAKGVGVCNGGAGQKWQFVPATTQPPPPPPTGFVFSPYKDITASADWNTDAMRSSAGGSLLPITSAMPSRNKVLTWAFATGACGSENWGGMSAATFAAINVPAFVAAGKQYIISTGGAAGSFNCGNDADFEIFLRRYDSPNLVGVDFDIEGGQSQADINNLVARVKAAQARHPNLRFSFTIATLATSQSGSAVAVDMGGASPNPLGATGIAVMNAIQSVGLSNYLINLMTMDYGSATPYNCVIANGACQMGQSAIQAAMDFHGYYKVPYGQIELTPMSGPNDTPGETFTLGDTDTVSAWSKANGIAGLHYWSFDRDIGLSFVNRFIAALVH
jgi:chitinase